MFASCASFLRTSRWAMLIGLSACFVVATFCLSWSHVLPAFDRSFCASLAFRLSRAWFQAALGVSRANATPIAAIDEFWRAVCMCGFHSCASLLLCENYVRLLVDLLICLRCCFNLLILGLAILNNSQEKRTSNISLDFSEEVGGESEWKYLTPCVTISRGNRHWSE